MISYTVGMTAGRIVGGAVVDSGSWRWVFWLNVPIGGVALLVLFMYLHVGYDKEMKLSEDPASATSTWAFIRTLGVILGLLYPQPSSISASQLFLGPYRTLLKTADACSYAPPARKASRAFVGSRSRQSVRSGTCTRKRYVSSFS
ncbi:methylenomycin a resistance protein [Paraphaeosphaeria sporulosa]